MDLENNVTPPEEEVLQAAQPEEMPVNDAPATEAALEQFALNTLPTEQPKPKKKTGLILGIAAAVAAIGVAVGLLLNFGPAEEPVEKKSPHQAILSQAQETLYGMTDALASGLHSLPTDYLDQEVYGAQCELHLTLSESLLEDLSSMISYGTDIPLDWLQDISLRYDMSSTTTTTQYLLELGLGNNTITTLDMILDLNTKAMYLGFPDLGDSYLKTDLVTTGLENADLSNIAQQMIAVLKDLWASIPTEAAMQSCLRSYADLVLDLLKDPEIDEETVTIDGNAQTFTTVTYQITEADLLKLYTAILEQAKSDEALKQLVTAFGNYTNTIMKKADSTYTKVDYYQELLSAIEDGLAELEEATEECENGNYLELMGYLDSQQKLQGLQLTVHATDEEPYVPFYWAEVFDGETEQVLITLSDGDEPLLTISGSQSEKNGLYNGTFELDFGDKRKLTLEFMDFDGKTGSIQLTPNITLLKEILGDSYSSLRLMLGSEMGLRLDLEKDGFGIHLTSEAQSVIGLTINDAKTTAGREIVLPDESKVYSSEDSLSWGATMDSTKLLDNLKKAGLPDSILALLGAEPEDAA